MTPTILVVDDEPVVRTLFSRVLAREGYQVRQAEDGVQTLADIPVVRPDLVLTDQVMPDMLGHDLVQHLTRHRDPIRCILMRAFDAHPPSMGVPFLSKPFDLATLKQLVAVPLTGSLSSFELSTPRSTA